VDAGLVPGLLPGGRTRADAGEVGEVWGDLPRADGLDATGIYLELAVRDVQLAAGVLRGVWESANGADGFVSLEVEPSLAHHTEAMLGQARDLWGRIDRPNAMIKIPGTGAGLGAIEEAIFDGINVYVTLLFSVASYELVAEAYIRGLERRAQDGRDLAVHSVASLFVSRIDSEVDKRLGAIGRTDLRGTAAIANAQAAYRSFKRIFGGQRFAALRAAGAPVQRPSWASTGVKDPRYSETKYVDDLVAPLTVNTMPVATLNAAAEHAEVRGATADADPTEALRALADAGIEMDEVTAALLEDGIARFIDPFDDLIAGIESAKEAAVISRPPTIRSSLPDELESPLAKRAQQAVDDDIARRVWRKDESLWGRPGVGEIGNRLGWLTITEPMLDHASDLEQLVDQVASEGFTDAALLGMGGSSLGPEVIRRSYASRVQGLEVHVLDSTDPAAVAELERALDLERTLFVVSSKSGGTVETLSHLRYFYDRTGRDGSRFVAVTDPGSPLVELAAARGFRRTLENDPNIGGRYSVLSYFGLVPAALMGVDVRELLWSAQEAEQGCGRFDSPAGNPGLWLGLTMGEAALRGRDKLTFVVSEPIASFGLWAEQLIAESTGKQGKGIVPVAEEPLGDPDSYGDDRVFAYLRNGDGPDEELDDRMEALARAGQPVVTVTTRGGPSDLGRLFFYAEFATAVAGWVLGVNPFDQPNVQEAKDNTQLVLEAAESPAIAEADDEALMALLGSASPPSYVALTAYVAPSTGFDEAVAELRVVLRDATRSATTFGYGPRFLHSTGQLHKGGPDTGRFLQMIHTPARDIEIPEVDYGFATLERAQADGDLLTLRDHDLPAERARLEGDPVEALRALTRRVSDLL